MTKRELNALTKLWQKRLELGHWKIKVLFQSEHEMGENAGCVRYMPEHSQAEICILRPEDREEGGHHDSIEEDLIHELLHITINGHKTLEDLQYDACFERGLNIIAKALAEGYQ